MLAISPAPHGGRNARAPAGAHAAAYAGVKVGVDAVLSAGAWTWRASVGVRGEHPAQQLEGALRGAPSNLRAVAHEERA